MFNLLNFEIDNETDTCRNCKHYEIDITGEGCTHHILYDKNDNIVDAVNDAIIECMENPRYCTLME